MVDRLKELCRINKTNFKRIEKELGMGNGSLAKADVKIRADRLKALSDYFNVSMEYLMTGMDLPNQAPLPFQNDHEFLAYVMRFWKLPQDHKDAVYKCIRHEERDWQDEMETQKKKDKVSAS